MTAANRLLKITALLCFLAVAFALFSQHILNMRPCAWCVLQRIILLAIGIVCLLAAYLPAVLRKLLSILAAILAISGIVAAWYQYTVAAEMFSCAQTFADKFITASGLDSMVPWLFGVYATCMDAKVQLFGIEYAIWGLLTFVVCLVLISLSIIGRRNHSA